ncbi:GIY-YIG nuclease family protein [Afipia clevelandensis]|uniref:GIY-YIG domain-containing protein n=1 Tax=Afipia clevelandensis ATCC 49720 TaxID=883079 RepID=K8P2A8_9BRAD|nr:GIY-YIG nuclease family protein [Afipia clevelandensis]EKS33820.1 hypothetical protein HMPREF9696_02940 [Afipia clevelandensis ATCC 49720]
MWYVYILRSVGSPDQDYTGATSDLKQRLADHNAGKSAHTAKFAPRRLVWYCAFHDKLQALSFETYLKSHSGRAFAKKRLLPHSKPEGPPDDLR